MNGSGSGSVRWPSATEYATALQRPDAAIVEPSLAGLQFVEGLYGMPASASGQHAIVFHGQHQGRALALRCSTTPAIGAAVRYRALEEHLAAHPVAALAGSTWHDRCVKVADREWPAVAMEWIEGTTLDRWMGERARDPSALVDAATRWRTLCAELRAARIAHGDLQHGNVLVQADGALRLVDFDGVWIPTLADRPSGEVGHPNYQHPQRRATGVWGEHVDAFSALLVYVALRAVAADPHVWTDHHDGEQLVLHERDLGDPTRPVWARLAASPDPEVVHAAARLMEMAAYAPDVPTDLEALLADAPGATPVPEPDAAASARDRDVPARERDEASDATLAIAAVAAAEGTSGTANADDEVLATTDAGAPADPPPGSGGGFDPPDQGPLAPPPAPPEWSSTATPEVAAQGPARRTVAVLVVLALVLAAAGVGAFLWGRSSAERADDAEAELDATEGRLESLREELGLTRESAEELDQQVSDLAQRAEELEGATEVDVVEVMRRGVGGSWDFDATPESCDGLTDCDEIGDFSNTIDVECGGRTCTASASFLRDEITMNFSPQRLRWEGNGRSSVSAGFICDGEEYSTPVLLVLQVDELVYDDGSWRPEQLRGTYTKDHDPTRPCDPASIRYALSAPS